ncbi:MAG TPA: thiamine pyrophosphate-dependent enzyme, partial [Polyangiaceae bacterium]|nr:thiamine pyrophosphate-dependent enzyme [Polyangiaceae bacterium]
VIEARESGIPLLVLSADRPFEQQQCGAQQTIDQTRLFGAYAAYFELGTPVDDRAALLGLRRMAWQAVATSLEPPRGAVHLNFRAKKPLEPSRERIELGVSAGRPEERLPQPGSRPPVSFERSEFVPDADVQAIAEQLGRSACPVLICGALLPADHPSPALVQRFARASNALVFPESVSQLRFRMAAEEPSLCDAYDWVIGSSEVVERARPDFAIQLGGAPLSAGLGRLIQESSETLGYAICAERGWPDSLHDSARIVRSRPAPLLEAICAVLERRGQLRPTREQRLWQRANALARRTVQSELEREFGEPEAVHAICEAVPAASLLVLGNSLPPRLIDRYCPAAARQLTVLSQRGAAGIDGCVAGALGAASLASTPTTLLLGDISFLHDIGSLWAARAERRRNPAFTQPVVIAVLNNGGGRIFEQLPLADLSGLDQGLWTTPHGMDLRAAAELYGLEFERVSERSALRSALQGAYRRATVTLLEVVVDAHSAAARLKRMTALLAARLAELAREP